MSYDNSASATQPVSQYGSRLQGPVETTSGLSATTENLLDRLEGILSCARRLNNKVHGPEPKAVNGAPIAPHAPDAPIARRIDQAHRLTSEIDNELTSIESRL